MLQGTSICNPSITYQKPLVGWSWLFLSNMTIMSRHVSLSALEIKIPDVFVLFFLTLSHSFFHDACFQDKQVWTRVQKYKKAERMFLYFKFFLESFFFSLRTQGCNQKTEVSRHAGLVFFLLNKEQTNSVRQILIS